MPHHPTAASYPLPAEQASRFCRPGAALAVTVGTSDGDAEPDRRRAERRQGEVPLVPRLPAEPPGGECGHG
jgi:hypothetical protein